VCVKFHEDGYESFKEAGRPAASEGQKASCKLPFCAIVAPPIRGFLHLHLQVVRSPPQRPREVAREESFAKLPNRGLSDERPLPALANGAKSPAKHSAPPSAGRGPASPEKEFGDFVSAERVIPFHE